MNFKQFENTLSFYLSTFCSCQIKPKINISQSEITLHLSLVAKNLVFLKHKFPTNTAITENCNKSVEYTVSTVMLSANSLLEEQITVTYYSTVSGILTVFQRL